MGSLEERAKAITVDLYGNGMIKTWFRHKPEGWTLVSGLWSPFYIQLRTLSSHPSLLKEIGEAMSQLLSEQIPEATRIIGIAMAGIPIAVATSLVSGLPSAFTRKTEGSSLVKKDMRYGEHAYLEGELCENDSLLIVDDVVTRFDTKLLAINQIQQEIKERGFRNVKCNHVSVVLDREQGATEMARAMRISLHPIIRFKTQALDWLSSEISPLERQVISDYLERPDKYQEPSIQEELAEKARRNRPLV
jgi:orotate phosphoribosyltransferase